MSSAEESTSSTPSTPSTLAAATPRRRGRLWMRVALAAVVLLLAALPADWLLGRLAGTDRRHVLRLDPGVELRHTSAEFDYVFHTNRLGLRGPALASQKPEGTRRLVVLGDSFVAGIGVADEDVFTTLLSARWKDRSVEVANVGRAGTSTVREVTLYDEVGRTFVPDVVVLGYYLGNDLAEVIEEEDDESLAAWRPQGTLRRIAHFWCPNLYLELAMRKRAARALAQVGPRTAKEIAARVREEAVGQGVDPQLAVSRYQALPADIRALAEQGKLPEYRYLQACLDPGRFRHSIDPGEEFFQVAWAKTERHLDRLRQQVAADGARLMLVVIPDSVQVDREAMAFNRQLGFDLDPRWQQEPQGRTAEALTAWARRADVPLLDLLPALRAAHQQKTRTYYVQDGHWTPAGHRVVAEELAAWDVLRKALNLGAGGP